MRAKRNNNKHHLLRAGGKYTQCGIKVSELHSLICNEEGFAIPANENVSTQFEPYKRDYFQYCEKCNTSHLR